MGKINCSGITSGLVKVVGEFVDDYQEFRKDAADIFVSTIIPGKPDAEKKLNQLVDDAIDLQTKLFKSYGVVAGESKGKIGPRCLTIPTKKVTGSLKMEREFVTALCPFDKVKITIKKTDGKAGADIAACVKYSNGHDFNKKDRSIEKGKDSIGVSKTIEFDDMADKILTIRLKQTGFVTDVCHYSVSIDGEFSEKTLESLNSTPVSKGKVVSSAVRP